MRRDLIYRTKLASASIDPDKLKNLKGDLSDLKNSDYQYLKDKIISIRSMESDIRFIYLLGLRNGKVFFFMDSEPANSPDYSPPGQLYDEASLALREIFTNREPFCEGPLPDRWGLWVTGFVPIINPDTDEVIAVCGMDIDGEKWNRLITASRITPVSVTFIIVLLLIIFFILHHLSNEISIKIIDSEKKYRTLFSEMLSGLSLYRVIVNETGQPVDFQFLDVNPAFEKLTGLRREDIIGKNRREFEIDINDEWIDIFKEVYLTGKPVHFEKYHSGFNKHFDVIVYSPQSGHLAVNFNDITESKESEKALRESEEKFRSITIAAQDGIIIMDNRGNISYWNRAAEKIFGYKEEEIVGKNLHHTLAPEYYKKEVAGAIEQWKHTGHGNVIDKLVELKALKKDGTEIEIELSLSSVKMSDTWHAIGIVRDITEKTKVQKELKKAKDAAEEANIAKSQFLANMSHEIRTPMNGIIGMTGLLLDTELTDTQREFALTIEKSADSLLNLINDILDFSKIESGKLKLEIVEFDLRAVVEDVVDLLAIKASEKKLAFGYLMYSNVSEMLRGDPGRVRQILINLTGNAIKFTEKGEVLISIKLEEDNDPYVKIRFSVSDTGIGIPEDLIKNLFQSFSQVDSSITRKYGGTGLGLAISKYLAEMMDGEIGVESTSGKGSTFWFTAGFKKQSGERPPTIKIEDIKGTNILIVDDNKTDRFVLSEQLRLFGCECEEAEKGVTALKILNEAVIKNNPFKIAIIDLNMPELDGIMLGRLIKKNEKIRDTILIMLSSLGHTEDAISMKKTGFSAYLTKPVKQGQLYRCLMEAMERKPVRNRFAANTMNSVISDKIKQKTRILLAEDNITNQKVALKMLEKIGYRANVVATGKEVLEAIEHIPYDLILMDVQMPDMDGLTATSTIRDKEKGMNKHIPIIAMTAYAMKGDRERCIEAGMDDYIKKPVQPKELLRIIEHFLYKEEKTSDYISDCGEEKGNEIYDREAFMKRIEGDTSFEKEIIRMVLKDIPDNIEELGKSIDKGDISQMAHLAHTIKGLAANIHANLLKEATYNLEYSCKKGEVNR
ncbi:MAG: response regulator, partial [Candidatus Eremiobacterota bacterium]